MTRFNGSTRCGAARNKGPPKTTTPGFKRLTTSAKATPMCDTASWKTRKARLSFSCAASAMISMLTCSKSPATSSRILESTPCLMALRAAWMMAAQDAIISKQPLLPQNTMVHSLPRSCVLTRLHLHQSLCINFHSKRCPHRFPYRHRYRQSPPNSFQCRSIVLPTLSLANCLPERRARRTPAQASSVAVHFSTPSFVQDLLASLGQTGFRSKLVDQIAQDVSDHDAQVKRT